MIFKGIDSSIGISMNLILLAFFVEYDDLYEDAFAVGVR